MEKLSKVLGKGLNMSSCKNKEFYHGGQEGKGVHQMHKVFAGSLWSPSRRNEQPNLWGSIATKNKALRRNSEQ